MACFLLFLTVRPTDCLHLAPSPLTKEITSLITESNYHDERHACLSCIPSVMIAREKRVYLFLFLSQHTRIYNICSPQHLHSTKVERNYYFFNVFTPSSRTQLTTL